MARFSLFYIRFMDDILVLASTRWRLRKAVQAVNEVLGSLRMEKNPEATVPYCWKHSKGADLLRHESLECIVDQDEFVIFVRPCIP